MADKDRRDPVVIEMHVEAFGDSRDETFEVDRAEWDLMTPEKRVAMAQEVADEFATNYVAWGWNITDPSDYASTEASAR